MLFRSMKFLKNMVKEYKIFGDLLNLEFEDTEKIYEAISTILNYIENSIPKEKIEKTIRDLDEEFYTLGRKINISKYGLDDRGKIFVMQEIRWIKGKLQELLERK